MKLPPESWVSPPLLLLLLLLLFFALCREGWGRPTNEKLATALHEVALLCDLYDEYQLSKPILRTQP